MINRRKFLASAIAVAVAPSVAPELPASIYDGEWDKFFWDGAGTSGSVITSPITLEQIRRVAAQLKEYRVKPIMHKGVPCYRLETIVGRSMIPVEIYEP